MDEKVNQICQHFDCCAHPSVTPLKLDSETYLHLSKTEVMKITPRYQYTSRRSLANRAARVTGPLSFLKLALEDLNVPFLYSRRSMSIEAGQGASFHVRHFDVGYDLYYHDEITAPGQPKGLRGISLLPSPTYPKGQWLVSKHIAPVSQEEREIYELDERGVGAYKLEAISLEMRVLAHKPLRTHPNIVDLVSFMWEKHPDELGHRWPILVLQDADCGTLSDFSQLDNAPLDSLPVALSIANDIASGLESLHACGVVHGDLKFENILIFEQPDGSVCAKISDFGLCSVVTDLSDAEITTLRLPAFSRPWEPPEVYNDVLVENLPMIDVYEFGLLLCRLMTSGSDIFEQYRKRDAALLEHAGTHDDANMEEDRKVPVDEAVLNEEEYDFNEIWRLKNAEGGMIDYAKTYLKLNSKASSAELEKLLQVVECSLHLNPDCRDYVDDIRNLLPGKQIEEVENTM
jgi:serine/threonine protein kinase